MPFEDRLSLLSQPNTQQILESAVNAGEEEDWGAVSSVEVPGLAGVTAVCTKLPEKCALASA